MDTVLSVIYGPHSDSPLEVLWAGWHYHRAMRAGETLTSAVDKALREERYNVNLATAVDDVRNYALKHQFKRWV